MAGTKNKGKLRHIAFAVHDLQKVANFYENSFGFTRVRESDVAVMLTDGLISITLLHLPTNRNTEPDERGTDFIGLHHMGFQIDDIEEVSAAIEANGGTYHGQIKNVGAGKHSERKYRAPDGVVIDIVDLDHAEKVWKVPKPGE